ncbi:A/G-specific DNA-adenine glycosylase [Tenacibaculum skagerrakense]|uniref:Adenine DNA glycosylase n=1 Tax=Tenacibaculum skagerrakense TaxID=186571 RepID=A0A4R2P079_9FLAO|nr:A/G-specific adenine glycosylase [Tenacibaculum skagerrakense]TCP28033.1 A/G-specific DNA-adenine glycosylase [Tenacibaculum skagerrakense]
MFFYKTLINWYLKNNRDLPWRKTQSPYEVWLSEIMLQQTRVAQGLPYFLKFTEAFPTVFDLANADESEVLKLWQGLGYYSRARNLHFTAKYVANELHGQFPNSYKELLKLKGIGDYTASAIASICFNEPAAVVDGNVYRVLSRFFGIDTPINSAEGIKEFKVLAQSIIQKDNPGRYNQAIMDFGALHCKPQNPLCNDCPLASKCVAFEKAKVSEFPVKIKKIKIKKRYFNYLVVISEDGKTLFSERTGKGIWQGLYQFPLLETSKNISVDELISNDEFTAVIPNDASISLFNKEEIVHKLSHQHLITKFWIIKVNSIEGSLVDWNDIEQFPTSVLISNFLKEYSKIE